MCQFCRQWQRMIIHYFTSRSTIHSLVNTINKYIYCDHLWFGKSESYISSMGIKRTERNGILDKQIYRYRLIHDSFIIQNVLNSSLRCLISSIKYLYKVNISSGRQKAKSRKYFIILFMVCLLQRKENFYIS